MNGEIHANWNKRILTQYKSMQMFRLETHVKFNTRPFTKRSLINIKGNVKYYFVYVTMLTPYMPCWIRRVMLWWKNTRNYLS